MRIRQFLIPIILVLTILSSIKGEGRESAYFISLSEAESLALRNSHLVEAQRNVVESADETAKAQWVRQFPMLGVEGNTRFVSKIGRITIPELGISREVGSHYNWSIGPIVDWIAFDAGQISKKAKSLKNTAAAESENLETNRRQVLLNARTAYIAVELAREQVRLIGGSLNLSRAQYNDVFNKQQAGTAALLDLKTAHQDVADRTRDLEEAKGELYIRRRALFAALGLNADSTEASLVEVEPIESVLKVFLPKTKTDVTVEAHPEVKSYEMKKEAADMAAASARAAHWPKLTLKGTATYEYPNLGEDTRIQQNTLQMGLKVPVIDWGLINKEARSQSAQARAALEQKKQTIIDLSRDLAQSYDLIESLKGMRKANVVAVGDAKDVARLTYDAFNAGQVIYLEVQRANFNMLTAQVDAARTNARLAMEIAKLLYFAEIEGVPQ